MKTRGKKLLASMAFATVAALGIVQSAQAAPVVSWGYDLYTRFEPVLAPSVFTPGGGSQIEQPGQVSWGDPSGNVFNAGSGRSGITISNPVNEDQTTGPAHVTGIYDTNAAAATGAWITHHNNSINGSFATLDKTTIFSTLTLTPIDPAFPAFPPATISFLVEFLETPNATPCVVTESPTPCNDIFALNGDQFNQAFVFAGDVYYISTFPTAGPGIVAGKLPFLGKAVCNAAGADDDCVGFTTPEDEITSIQFGFRITSEPIQIPEPGSLALAGLGLAALAGLGRRRKTLQA